MHTQPQISASDAQRTEMESRNILQKITELAQCDRYLRLKDGTLAFSGTEENPDLLLFLAPQENGGFYYGVSVNEEECSYESSDYPSVQACSDEVAKFLAAFINHTAKFTRIQKRFSYIYDHFQAYDETSGQWQTISETLIDSFPVKCCLWKNFSTEWEKTFQI